jgi:hypothetical protein
LILEQEVSYLLVRSLLSNYMNDSIYFYKTRDQANLEGYNRTGGEMVEYIVFFELDINSYRTAKLPIIITDIKYYNIILG